MRTLIIAIIGLSTALPALSQNRSEHPFQLQVNLSGLALNALGEDLRRRDVIDLEVQDYTMPGLSVGYHMSSKFYLGYSFHPNRRYILNEAYSFEGGIDDILLTLDHNSGTFHTLEARLSPFNLGLYASAFITHISEATYSLDGVPIEDSYMIAEDVFTDALSADWNFKDMTTFGLGIGYNQVFGNGISFNIGAGFPVRFIEDIYDDVQVIQSDSEFSEEDIQVIQQRLESEDFYFPVQFHLSIGKNF